MRRRLSPIDAIGLAGLVVGLLLLFLGSGGTAKVGIGIAALAVVFLLADKLPPGGGFLVSPQRWRGPPADPEPEYIEKAAVPTEEEWAAERKRYREKEHRDPADPADRAEPADP